MVPILHNGFQPIVLYGALELFSSSCRIIMKRYSKKNREAIRGLQLSSFSPRKRKSWPGALASSYRACFWDFSVLQPAASLYGIAAYVPAKNDDGPCHILGLCTLGNFLFFCFIVKISFTSSHLILFFFNFLFKNLMLV